LAQPRAATTQTPRRPIGAGGARGASHSGSASVITTHAVFARKGQRKLSNGVLALPPADHLLIERQRPRPIRAFSATPIRTECLLKIPAEPSPSCVSPAPQLKREWSPWPKFGADREIRASFQKDNLRRHFPPTPATQCGLYERYVAEAARARPIRALGSSSVIRSPGCLGRANSLQSQNSAGFPQIYAIVQSDNLRRHF